ncbi:HD domain-containing protein [Streptomyces sp. CA-253872]|uniref:HD domain-containing protein n=1 Tax=Streptomyces sp. CA-253872 TaxID=3240067 RepID=UPI003D8BB9D5
MSLTTWAYALSEDVLAEPLPRRWAHVQGVAERARGLRELFTPEDAEMLEAAAVLHDIGYAPALAHTGFHPLDGARFLRNQHADPRVTNLVANHSFALLEAEERGLRADLADEFPLERADLVDALVYCDMTTTPDGGVTNTRARVAEIAERYEKGSVVARFIRRAAPEIHAASDRVEGRLAAARKASSHPM